LRPAVLPDLPITITRQPALETTVKELEEALHPSIMTALANIQQLNDETVELSSQIKKIHDMNVDDREVFVEALELEVRMRAEEQQAILEDALRMRAEEQQAILDDLIAREQDRSTVVLSLMNEVSRLRRFIYKVYGKEHELEQE